MRDVVSSDPGFPDPQGGSPASVGYGSAEQTYPTPREMFLKIGLAILAAACIGVSVDYLMRMLAP